MEQNDCKTPRLRRKLVLQQRFNARSNQHSCKSLTSYLKHLSSSIIFLKMMHLYVCMFFYVVDDKEENARKKTKFANHSSQSK